MPDLKAARRQRGLSQRDVADLVGVRDHSIVSRWERGTRRPYDRNARRLVAIFNAPLEELLPKNENGADSTGTDAVTP